MLLKNPLPNNLLLLRNRLQRLVLRLRLHTATNNDAVLGVALFCGHELVVRPRRHVLGEFLCESVADDGAVFALDGVGLVVAALDDARVDDVFVGEDAACHGKEEEGEGEGEGEALHCGGCYRVTRFVVWFGFGGLRVEVMVLALNGLGREERLWLDE